jgi:hypothetical protein
MKPISHTYFAIKAPNDYTEEKVRYFVELSYWLMSLSFAPEPEVPNTVTPPAKNNRYFPL